MEMSLPFSRPWPAGKTAVAELKDRPESSFPLARRYADKMIAHAREEAPNECCGILAGPANEGRVEKLYHGINAEKSPVRYNIDPQQLLSIHEETEAKGWAILGIYHSHTHTEAFPSATDVRLAFWPDSTYLIISLKEQGEPVIRAFSIRDGRIEEKQVVIGE
ncbi:MAG: family peptidase [Dehalococcoidia bacterium]|nr:family peptidase [Dehalococcoidia bacterium]